MVPAPAAASTAAFAGVLAGIALFALCTSYASDWTASIRPAPPVLVAPAAPLPFPAAPPIAPAPAARAKLKLLCWVPLRTPADVERSMVSETWARQCDAMMFIAEQGNASLGVLAHHYSKTETLDLWNQIHRAWAIVYQSEHFASGQFDWVIKIDSDAYFSGLNFRALVQHLNPDAHHQVGHVTYQRAPALFLLGATIALTRGTLRDFVRNSAEKCAQKSSWAEDWQLFKCLRRFSLDNTTLTYDSAGRDYFLLQTVSGNMITMRPKLPNEEWIWENKPLFIQQGTWCCAARPVTFHGLKVKFGISYYWRYLDYWLFVHVDPALDTHV